MKKVFQWPPKKYKYLSYLSSKRKLEKTSLEITGDKEKTF